MSQPMTVQSCSRMIFSSLRDGQTPCKQRDAAVPLRAHPRCVPRSRAGWLQPVIRAAASCARCAPARRWTTHRCEPMKPATPTMQTTLGSDMACGVQRRRAGLRGQVTTRTRVLKNHAHEDRTGVLCLPVLRHSRVRARGAILLLKLGLSEFGCMQLQAHRVSAQVPVHSRPPHWNASRGQARASQRVGVRRWLERAAQPVLGRC